MMATALQVYRDIVARKGASTEDDTAFPFIRTLLLFDTHEFLNVLSLAFDEVRCLLSAASALHRYTPAVPFRVPPRPQLLPPAFSRCCCRRAKCLARP